MSTFEEWLAGRNSEPECTVPQILAGLPTDGHRKALEAYLAKPVREVPTSRIERAIRELGIKVSRPKLDEHRRGDCDCDR